MQLLYQNLTYVCHNGKQNKRVFIKQTDKPSFFKSQFLMCFACKHVNTKTNHNSLFHINHQSIARIFANRYFLVVIDDTCQYTGQEGVKTASFVPSKKLSYF